MIYLKILNYNISSDFHEVVIADLTGEDSHNKELSEDWKAGRTLRVDLRIDSITSRRPLKPNDFKVGQIVECESLRPYEYIASAVTRL